MLTEIVGIHVPFKNLGDFLLFTVDFLHKSCPSDRCASAALAFPFLNQVMWLFFRGSHNLMSAVHLHHGLGHRSVIMVGAGAEGGEQLLEEVDEGLIEEEDEVRKYKCYFLLCVDWNYTSLLIALEIHYNLFAFVFSMWDIGHLHFVWTPFGIVSEFVHQVCFISVVQPKCSCLITLSMELFLDCIAVWITNLILSSHCIVHM